MKNRWPTGGQPPDDEPMFIGDVPSIPSGGAGGDFFSEPPPVAATEMMPPPSAPPPPPHFGGAVPAGRYREEPPPLVRSAEPESTAPATPPPVLPPPTRQKNGPTTAMAVGIACVVGVVAIGVGLLIGSSSSKSSSSGSSTSSTLSAGSTTADNSGGPLSASYQPPPPPPADPHQQLVDLANADRGYVMSQLADRWVPQLSSKRPGVVDDGLVYNDTLTMQEHQRLRQQYGAKLLWSGDWSTFDGSGWWVTVASAVFSDAAGALQWCTSHGLDPDHCYAKLISTTHGISGSTAHN